MFDTKLKGSISLKFGSSVVWSGIDLLSGASITLVVMAALARLLSPADFGLLGIASIFVGFISLFSTAGLSSLIVQYRDITERQHTGLFCVSIVLGLSVATLVSVCAPWLSRVYRLPQLIPITVALGVTMFFSALAIVPRGMLQRRMAFRPIALADIASGVLAGIAAISVAVKGGQYWALITNIVVKSAALSALLFINAGWLPSGRPQLPSARRLLGFSGNLTLFNAINYWARNLDNLLIAAALGPVALGIYTRAYALMMYPVQIFTSISDPVLHPLLVDVQNDKARIKYLYFRVLKVVALSTFSIGMLLAIFPREIVYLLWGNRWQAVVPILRYLSAVCWIQPVVASTGVVFMALGRADLLLRIGAINSVVLCAGIVVGFKYGRLEGVAIGFAIAYGLIVLPTLQLLMCTLGGRLGEMGAVLRGPAIVALAVACTGVVIKWSATNSEILRTSILGLVSTGLVFIAACLWLERPLMIELRALATRLIPALNTNQ